MKALQASNEGLGWGGWRVCYNSELIAFKVIVVGSQCLGMRSILFAVRDPIETVGG